MSTVTLPTTVYDLLILKGLLLAGKLDAERMNNDLNVRDYAAWIVRVNAALEGKV